VPTPNASSILVDSSGWLELLIAGPKAPDFQPHLQEEPRVIVPTMIIYEVYKKLAGGTTGNLPNVFLSTVSRCRVVPCDSDIAVAAAQASLQYKLAMADAIIFATARIYEAQIVTTDPDFQGLPGVTLI